MVFCKSKCSMFLTGTLDTGDSGKTFYTRPEDKDVLVDNAEP